MKETPTPPTESGTKEHERTARTQALLASWVGKKVTVRFNGDATDDLPCTLLWVEKYVYCVDKGDGTGPLLLHKTGILGIWKRPD